MFKIIKKAAKKIIFGAAKSAVMLASAFAFKKIAAKSINKFMEEPPKRKNKARKKSMKKKSKFKK